MDTPSGTESETAAASESGEQSPEGGGPTSTTIPPRRTKSSDSLNTIGTPAVSMTMSGPTPSVSALAASRRSSRGAAASRVSLAPIFPAISRRDALRSVAMIRSEA